MKRTLRKLQAALDPYMKWLVLPLYLTAIFYAWQMRRFCPAPLGMLTRDMVLFSLALTVFICLVQLLRGSPLLRRRFERSMRQAGFQNAEGEYPVLTSVKRDQEKEHGVILTVKNMGISIPDFDRRIDRLQTSLNGKVYCMEYGRKTIYTRLYFLPQKYVRPTYIFPTDEAIGSISVKRLINMLIIGATGLGKTVCVKILMAKIAKFQPDAKIWLLDFKRFDFQNFSGLPRYYGHTNCIQGLLDYYEAFKIQQETGLAGSPNYLVIDEWGSFIMSLEKKEAEQLKGKLAELLMLGRAYQFFPIVGIQRPDAAYFASSRDNFQTCLALGNLSPEGRRMVFPDSAASQIVECKKREGHLYIEGVGLEKVRIADIPNMDALDATIREAMRR